MRVYTVILPLVGSEEGYPIARCESPEVVAELVRVLLVARATAPDRIEVRVEERMPDGAIF